MNASTSTSPSPIFFAYHTTDDYYTEQAKLLTDSLDKLGLDWHLTTGPPDNWLAVVRLLPQKILDFYESTDRPVIFVGADTEVLKWPYELLNVWDHDVAMPFADHRPQRQWYNTGVLLFNDTPAAEKLLRLWAAMTNGPPLNWNETKTLNMAISGVDVKIKNLPYEYWARPWAPGVQNSGPPIKNKDDIVIQSYLASRNATNREGIDGGNWRGEFA